MPAPDDIVDRGFLEARGKLLEVAAFLDRAERYGRADDYRVAALKQAMRELCDAKQVGRAEAFLRAMSDPTSEPAPQAGKPAAGAWEPKG
ncbi:hypothetical protein [Cerasicoccus fimbriatus]|uniref:hypothetical protein n=1 Tax=Cerasicoccus fimbriatus TaxID=3014554 RepID=UPI0022B38271|nr:hypothetical protein [Cerasicoccus sp. TK19100]